jgi:hypothetical protein
MKRHSHFPHLLSLALPFAFLAAVLIGGCAAPLPVRAQTDKYEFKRTATTGAAWTNPTAATVADAILTTDTTGAPLFAGMDPNYLFIASNHLLRTTNPTQLFTTQRGGAKSITRTGAGASDYGLDLTGHIINISGTASVNIISGARPGVEISGTAGQLALLADIDATAAALTAALATKQDVLTAGENITIAGGTISAGGTFTAGFPLTGTHVSLAEGGAGAVLNINSFIPGTEEGPAANGSVYINTGSQSGQATGLFIEGGDFRFVNEIGQGISNSASGKISFENENGYYFRNYQAGGGIDADGLAINNVSALTGYGYSITTAYNPDIGMPQLGLYGYGGINLYSDGGFINLTSNNGINLGSDGAITIGSTGNENIYIKRLVTPTDLMDAANKEYVDTAVAGAAATFPLTSQYVTLSTGYGITYLRSSYLTATTSTLAFEGGVDGRMRVRNISNPSSIYDAANKDYVDGIVGKIGRWGSVNTIHFTGPGYYLMDNSKSGLTYDFIMASTANGVLCIMYVGDSYVNLSNVSYWDDGVLHNQSLRLSGVGSYVMFAVSGGTLYKMQASGLQTSW